MSFLFWIVLLSSSSSKQKDEQIEKTEEEKMMEKAFDKSFPLLAAFAIIMSIIHWVI